MSKILLLGDSIIDNQIYLNPTELSTDQAIANVFNKDEVVMEAVDGYVIRDVIEHINQIDDPESYDHVILSVGGNDVLYCLNRLDAGLNDDRPQMQTKLQAIASFSEYLNDFHEQYDELIRHIRYKFIKANITVFTIYEGNLQEVHYQPDVFDFSRVGIAIFNDSILRIAIAHKLHVLELRDIFTNSSFYANPIEPSAKGSQQIAERLHHALAVASLYV